MGALADIPQSDLDILRRLLERKVKFANDPTNVERRSAWYAHDAGPGGRPMVLAEHGGVRDANSPVSGIELSCQSDAARRMERGLHVEAYLFETLKDDHVVEPYLQVAWQVHQTGYGVDAAIEQVENEGKLTAHRWEPAIADIDRDFDKLTPRTFSVDRASTLAAKAELESLFGDILPVRIRGGYWWTFGMTIVAVKLIGLEQLMLFMYDDPDGVHRIMKFLHDDQLAFTRWLEAENLLTLNNENDYIGSGSMGYTHGLPRSIDGVVRASDLWLLLESQETVGVGPDQFAEFIYPYQASLAETYGKVYYGCCEPVHSRWSVLRDMPNLERVSISAWCDEAKMAEALGTRHVYSRKPNPTLISTERFDEDAIRADLRQTLTVARDCRVELIMKDVHTLNNEPTRLARWVQLARETVDEVWG